MMPNFLDPRDKRAPTLRKKVISGLVALLAASPLMADIFYVATKTNGKIGGLEYKNQDILQFDTLKNEWSIYFDGSDVGLAKKRINGFYVGGDYILLSLAGSAKLDIGGDKKTKILGSDIVKFNWDPESSPGNGNTKGTFELFFDGSDVRVKRNIDALTLDQDGRLVFSLIGKNKLPQADGKLFVADRQDLVRFIGNTGPNTNGYFELFFDGKKAGLNLGRGEIDGVDLGGEFLYLTTSGKFNIGGIKGTNKDILRCDFPAMPIVSLPVQTCGNPQVIFNIAEAGLARQNLQDIQVLLSIDIALSASTVAENKPAFWTVGDFSTSNTGAGDTIVYSLVDGAGGADNASFRISGNQLQTAAPFDFETKSGYSIRIRSEVSDGRFFESPFAVTVLNANDAPADLALSAANVAENQPLGTAVGNFSTTDPDSGDTHTYTLAAGAGDTDNAAFTIVGNTLQTAAVFDFETKSSYSIRVRSTDNGGLPFEKELTITVDNGADAPTGIALTPNSVAENLPSGTLVGSLSSTDSDPGDTHSYALVAGAGDNALFAIFNNNELRTAAMFDFERKSGYSIRVASTDSGGRTFKKTLSVAITDANDAPTLTAGGVLVYSENAPVTAIDAGVKVADEDNTTLVGATVAISGNFQSNQDVLEFVDQSGISGSYNAGSGVLTLSGSAALADYQAALRSVAYRNTSDGPNPAVRTVTWTVNDGTANSAGATSTIAITAVNDAPSFAKGADQNVNEDAGAQTVAGWATAISAGPSNESGQTLTFNVTGNTNPGLFSAAPAISSTGELTYTPAANANGSATITLTLSDSGGTANGGVDTSTAQTFVINVTAVNDAPSFTKGADQTVNEDAGAQTVPGWATAISAGAADEAAQTLTFAIIGNTNPGLFAVAPAMTANGTLSYTPAADAHGVASIQIALTDDGGTANGGANTSPPTTMTITVNSANDAPSFTKGTDQTVFEDAGAQTVPGWATAMSAGPANESGQNLSFNITANDNAALFSTGPAVDPATGALTFTPAANANGTANVQVALMDDGGTANGGVSSSGPQSFAITVNAVNDAPAGTNKTVTALEGGDYVFSAADFGFTDPDDSPANALLSVKIATLPGTGSLTLSGSGLAAGTEIAAADIGNLKFTPAANTNGAPYASFTFQVRDNGGTADGGIDLDQAAKTIAVNVTPVNDAPAGTDKTVTADEDAAYVFSAADFGFTDPDDSPANALLSVKIATLPGTGSLTLSGSGLAAGTEIAVDDIDAGNLKFVPAADASGAPYASFTFQVRDDGGIDNGGIDLDTTARTMTVNIDALNDAPVNTVPDAQTTNEDTSLVFNAANDNPISVNDVDAGGADLQITLGVTSGSLTLSGTGGLIFSDGDGTDDTSMTLTGDLTAINAALNGLSFQPAADATDSVTLTLTSDDQGATGAGGALSDTDTVTIDINPVNDAPVIAMPGTTPAYAGSAVVLDSDATVNDIDSADFDTGVLIADIIADCEADDRLAVFDQGAGAGHITLDGNTVQYDFGSGPTAIGELATDFDCSNTTPSLTITLNASADPVSTRALMRNLTYTSATATPTGTERTVRVTLSDGDGGVSSPVDKFLNIDSPPEVDSITPADSATDVAVNSNIGIFFSEAVDATADAFSVECPAGNAVAFTSTPALPASNATAFQLTPDAALPYGATCTVTVRKDEIDDHDAIDPPSGMVADFTSTFSMVVNTAPSFIKGADQTANEDAGAQSVSGWATAISDGDGDTQVLTFNVTGNTNPDLFSAGPSISPTGVLTYTPEPNANGSATITLTLSDNGGTANGGVDTSTEQTFVINVTQVNDAPSFTKGADQTVLEDAGAQTVAGWATAISAGPSNESGQTLTFNVTGNTNPGLFSAAPAISSTGELTYTPAANANGSATITLTLSDSGGTANGGVDTSAAQTFTITVTDVNDAPSFTGGGNQTVNEDAGQVTANGWASSISAGPNESGQTVSFVIDSNDNPSLFSAGPAVAADGTLTFTPAANQNGVANIILHAQDNGGTSNGGDNTSDTVNFTITVQAVNDPPQVTAPGPFDVTGNVSISVPAPGLLTTVSDPADGAGAQPFTIDSDSFTSSQGGSVSVNTSTGAFTYNPPAGYEGEDSFTYQVCDSGVGLPASACTSATVNLTVSGMVWFIDNTAAAGGDGRLSNPFNTLAAFEDVNGDGGNNPAAGDNIFLYESASNYTGPVTLLNNQKLLGQDATAELAAMAGITLAPNSEALPASNSGNGTIVSITSDSDAIRISQGASNTLRGFTIGNVSSANTALTATNFGTLTVNDVAIATNGRALNLDTGTLAATFSSVSSNGSGNQGVRLNAANGSLTINGGSIQNAGGADFSINQGAANVTYAGTITDDVGSLVSVTNTTGGTKTFSGAVSDGNDGDGNGITLTSNTGATINFSGGLTLSTGANPAFAATGGGTVNVTGSSNTLQTTTATALNVASTNIGSDGLTFQSISAGTGSGSAGVGISLNSTGLTGSNGGLTVTGTGTAGSGGTIQHKTGTDDSSTAGIGIFLKDTKNASFNWMQLNDFDNSGIVGRNVQGFTLQNSILNGVIGSSSDPVEGPISFGVPNGESISATNGLQGTGLIRNVKISGGIEHNVEFYNQSGSMSLTIDGSSVVSEGANPNSAADDTADCIIEENSTVNGSDGILMEMQSTATATVVIDRCLFRDNRSQAVQIMANDSSAITATIDESWARKFDQGNEGFILSNGGNGDLTAMISNNHVNNYGGTAIFVGQTPSNATASSLLNATIINNVITQPTTATNHGIIAFLTSTVGQASQARVRIDGNNVTNNSLSGTTRGILVDTPDTSTSPVFHATVTNNSVAVGDNVAGVAGLVVQARQSSDGCANIGSNTVTFPNGNPGVNGLRARQVSPAAYDFEQSASCTGTAAEVLACRNPSATTEALGTINPVSAGSCLLPVTP
jgi:hypothetical protein